MATRIEHMKADVLLKFSDPDGDAVNITIAGVENVRAFVRYLETDASLYEGAFVERVSVWLIPGTIEPLPRPEKEIDFNSGLWNVESRIPGKLADKLTLMRYSS